jgi:glycosyltransferase involved in cell wall biosynthesis
MTPPRVTVLMAVHDEERFVGAAMRSILDQTLMDFEFLIVDDASRDASAKIIASFGDPRVRVVDNPERLGLTKSLNRGLALARAEYVARFDANDVSRSDRLARQVAFLDANARVVAVGSRIRHIRPRGAIIRRRRLVPPLTREGIDWALMFWSPLAHPASMFRRSAVDRLGGYDERFLSSQDIDLWSRLATVGELANLPEALLDLRVDPSSISGYRNTARRLQMIGPVTRMMSDNLRRLTGQRSFPDGWPAMWIRLMQSDPTLGVTDALRALDLLSRTRERFAAVRPESRHSREIADHMAFFHEQAAFHLCRDDKRAALRVFARGLAHAPAHAVRNLPRFVVRLVFGEPSVRLWRMLAHR